jgi:hypothetical protein
MLLYVTVEINDAYFVRRTLKLCSGSRGRHRQAVLQESKPCEERWQAGWPELQLDYRQLLSTTLTISRLIEAGMNGANLTKLINRPIVCETLE